MQQYRLNYPLLIGLMIGTVLLSGLVTIVWKFQIERKAGALIVEAQNAYEAGDINKAVLYFGQYVSLQPQDIETRIRFANTYADLAEQPGASPEDRRRAVMALEATLRDLPDEKGLRRRLAEFYGKVGMYQDAFDHLGFILDDPEAQVMRATYLVQSRRYEEAITYSYKLIGFDPNTEEFVGNGEEFVGNGTSPNDPTVYANLAVMLRVEKDRPDLAEQVIDQAVKVNPNSAAAYLARGQYFISYGEKERGESDVEKAFEISPDDANVLLTVTGLAATNEEYDKAREVIDKGIELHPQDPRFYQSSARLYLVQKDIQGAIAQIDEGLKAIPGPAGQILLVSRADFQLQAADLSGVRETIQRMEEASFIREFRDWYEARVLAGEQKWFQSNALFKKLRPWASNYADKSVEINAWLGLTYEKSGQYELAKQAYDLVLNKYPQHELALLGKQRVAMRIGSDADLGAVDPIQRAVDEELKKPKAAQDWERVGEVLGQYAEDHGWDEVTREVGDGNVLLARGEYAQARDLAEKLRGIAPDNVRVMRLAVRAVWFDPAPNQGPEQALQLLERMDVDVPIWRLDKADLLIAINDERTKPELARLLTGLESWSDTQKVALWNGMADRYLRLRMLDDALHCLRLVADASPDDLQTRMRLFALALDNNDDAGMTAAQKEILDIVGSKNDANWLFAEARHKLSLMQRGRLGKESLGDIRRLVERALIERPEWHELHVLNADIELLAGNSRLALQHYDRVERENLGRMSPLAMARYIQLLAAYGEIDRAAEKLDELPESIREPLLGPLEIELLFRTKKVEEAIATAREQAEAKPDDARAQFRYGQLLARSSEQPGVSAEQKKAILRQAIQAVEQAVKVQPQFADAWYTIILYNAMAGEKEQAYKALRDVQLSLNGDELQFILAKCYEAMGQWLDAESMYSAVYEAKPDDIERAKQLAAFYLGSGYQQPDYQDKATPFINQILRAGADGRIPPSDANLLLARRMGARLLASSGDYQQLRKAERLLASNSLDGILSLEDSLEMARILSPRPEPESRIKAAHLLEKVNDSGQLNEEGALMLGKLYYARGDWLDCQRQMRRAIVQFSESQSLLNAYVRMLLSKGGARAYSEAETNIKALTKLAPNDPNTFELMVRLAIKTGKREEVLPVVVRQIPRITDPKTQLADANNVRMMVLLASLLTELKDFERAEQIYRLLVEADPNRVFTLARFLGLYRDVQKCFDLLEAEYSNERVADVLNVAVSVIQVRRDEIGDKYDARVEDWLERALSVNPGSASLLLTKAQFLELQGNDDEAITIYAGLRDSPDLIGFRRAVLLNNLAFLLTLSSPGAAESGVDPLQLVEEAAEILGPTADILDTRAVVLTDRKQYQQAIHDLELSLTDNPTAAKYFHKATAELDAGQNTAAIESWEKAESLGLTPDVLNRLEHQRYQEVKSKIEQLRTGSNSVTRAEPAVQ